MVLTFPAGYKSANPQAAKRTEEFFGLAGEDTTTDAQLTELVKQGVCLEARDNEDWTPLIWAANKGHTATAQALLAAGADSEARNDASNTALYYAALCGHTGTLKALLAAGAEIEARDNRGRTALIEAAINGHTATVHALLARGANIYAQANNGKRPIDNEAVSKHVESWLQEYADFVATKNPPKDAASVYRLLAVTPLLDEKAPVDRVANLARIMSHANWVDKTRPAEILSEMAADGSITPE
ncbi:MAG: ankyrin repeat domain-containing protein, partial [Alphaproteobacteria bacterium]